MCRFADSLALAMLALSPALAQSDTEPPRLMGMEGIELLSKPFAPQELLERVRKILG